MEWSFRFVDHHHRDIAVEPRGAALTRIHDDEICVELVGNSPYSLTDCNSSNRAEFGSRALLGNERSRVSDKLFDALALLFGVGYVEQRQLRAVHRRDRRCRRQCGLR